MLTKLINKKTLVALQEVWFFFFFFIPLLFQFFLPSNLSWLVGCRLERRGPFCGCPADCLRLAYGLSPPFSVSEV